MKKSRSSVPLFIDKCPPGPAPPVRYEGLLPTAGRPEPELAAPPAVLFVAIAVGNTKDGESLPANPIHALVYVPHSNSKELTKLRKTSAAVQWLALTS
jgi:hypothetical protein